MNVIIIAITYYCLYAVESLIFVSRAALFQKPHSYIHLSTVDFCMDTAKEPHVHWVKNKTGPFSSKPPLPLSSLSQLLALSFISYPAGILKVSLDPCLVIDIYIHFCSLSNQSLESDHFASSTFSLYILSPLLDKNLLIK